MATIILDPGHGGRERVGGSSPNRSSGRGGTLEKVVALELARRLGAALGERGHRAVLTRDGDDNRSLAGRAQLAEREAADALVSLHFNHDDDASVQASETWVHGRSQRLAHAVQAALVGATGLGDGGIHAAELAVLDPAHHGERTAACLCEVSYLSDPREERRLGDGSYLQRIADRLAQGIEAGLSPRAMEHRTEEHFDVWHEVPLVPQVTGMSCWAAAAAMIIGWRDRIDIDPEELARAGGRWEEYRDGLIPENVDTLAQAFGLIIEPLRPVTAAALRKLLVENGPLWVGEASPALHVIVVAGLVGDGTLDGTRVRVIDPWPIGRGERYMLTLRQLFHSLKLAADLSGARALTLHAGGRGAGSRASSSSWHHREELSARLAGDRGPRFGTPVGLFQYLPRASSAAAPSPADDSDWYSDWDLGQGPAEGAGLLKAADARFAEDDQSPDYRHLMPHAGRSQTFTFTADHLRKLCQLNWFSLDTDVDEVLFGLRGCRRTEEGDGDGVFARSVCLSEDLPNHHGFHCVLGVWRRSTDELTVFNGSTVPNWRHMERQRAAGAGAQLANLLPTGRYTYSVGKHRAVNGAFLSPPDVVVLRSNDDLVYEVSDVWEKHSPADNIHPGFRDRAASFSSAGCQTVPGSFSSKKGHTGTWAVFRAAAGLDPADTESRWGERYAYVLLTGREARLVTQLGDVMPLRRLRFGSVGPAVGELQQKLIDAGHLAGTVDHTLGASTALAYIAWQQARDAGAADGIVTPAAATRLGATLYRPIFL
jgi:N-acetylmuramoyl-L-alanine amidase